MKKWLEELKKDKKKALILFVVLTLLLITILFTFLNGKETTPETKTTVNDVEVPVDSSKVNQHGNTNGERDNFFDVRDDQNVDEPNNTNELNGLNNLVGGKPRAGGTHKVYYENVKRPSASNEYYEPKSQTTLSTSTIKELDSKRRRAPNDASGNMSGAATSVSKSMFNCVMYNDGKAIRSGSYVTMRVAEDIEIGGVLVPKNTVITGVASLNDERMQIAVSSVKIGSSIKNVKWIIYDQDANAGVAIPQSVLTDISRDAADEALKSEGSKVDVSVPVVGNVKLNLKKRNKEVSFIVPNGHKLYVKVL